MTPQPEPAAPGRHGSYAGAIAHYAAGHPPCSTCRIAFRRTQKRNQHLRLTGQAPTIPAAGTVRRVRALQALGWTIAEVAETAGVPARTLNGVLLGRGASVYRSTASAVERAFGQMEMRRAPDTRNARRARAMAQRRKWAPPLAWDDIDRDEAPQGARWS